MKTAEEWNWNHTQICANDPSVHGQLLPTPKMVEFIQAIQLDAYRAGMLRAAEIVPQAGVYGDLNTKARKAILTAANNLKPEDLK